MVVARCRARRASRCLLVRMRRLRDVRGIMRDVVRSFARDVTSRRQPCLHQLDERLELSIERLHRAPQRADLAVHLGHGLMQPLLAAAAATAAAATAATTSYAAAAATTAAAATAATAAAVSGPTAPSLACAAHLVDGVNRPLGRAY